MRTYADCGRENRDGAVFCADCGTELPDDRLPSSRSAKKVARLFVLAAVLAVLGAGGYAVWIHLVEEALVNADGSSRRSSLVVDSTGSGAVDLLSDAPTESSANPERRDTEEDAAVEEDVREDGLVDQPRSTRKPKDVATSPPSPPEEAPDRGDRFRFTPYTVEPKCEAGCSPSAILRHLPPKDRRNGVSCRLTVGIRINTEGRVVATDLLQSSGNPSCDEAAREWAHATTWSTAYNRNQPVVVWIAQPIEIRTR